MSIPLYQVDAFTDRPFAGNPAAVCLGETHRDAAWMQDVAAEMNLAETAFVVPRDDGFDIRWFTPATEVDLCGHATLAAAHVLWEQGRLSPDAEARFHTRVSGVLTARLVDGWIELNFPSYPPKQIPAPADLLEGLGVKPLWVGRHGQHLLAEVDSPQTLRGLRPDYARFSVLDAGVIATILDSACGFAAFTLMPADAAVLSIEFKVNLLAPAIGDRFIARGRVVRAGRTITVCQGDAFAVEKGAERHCASMTATMMTVLGRKGLKG